jgi:hypothetical protein
MTTRKTKPASKRTARKATKSTTRGRTRRAAGAKDSKGLKVRMYRVGFGDFFLITVPTSSGNQYILIDCGVFKGTSGTGDIGSIVDAVEDMFKTTKGHLALVIMTHRHADHIAGFSKAPRFKDFTASMVWMPYWEQFNDPKDKTKKAANKNLSLDKDDSEEEIDNSAYNLLVDIDQLATNLALQFSANRKDPEGKEALAQLANATGIEDFSAAADGKKKGGGGNAAALDLLKNHLGNNGKNVRYYAADDEAELPEELEGLKATILGPPPEKAKAFLALMDLKKGVGQYLDSMNEEGGGPPKALQPFPKEWHVDQDDYPEVDVREKRIDYQQFIQYVDNAQPDMLVAAASKIENFLNNQSLVVLFEFGGKKLLFAGDAQGGNWEYWLFKTDEPQKDPTKAGDIVETSKEILQTIDFYKVGHHGSTNATPIQAVEAAIARPKGSKGFVSMCSTQDGVFGSIKNASEVPRIPLMKALGDGSCLVRSDAIPITISDGQKKKVIQPTKGVTLPTPKVGKINKADLYIEYSF